MRARAGARFAAAGTLLGAAPLAGFLATNGYPLLSAEAGLLGFACVAFGALVGLAAALRTALGALLLGVGALLALDSMYGAHFSKPGLVLVPLACVACALCLRRHIAAVVAVAAAVFVAGALLIPAPHAGAGERLAAPAPRSQLPLLLHLVLDEHIGLDGLPEELPETAQLRRRLGEDYVAAGFRLYAGAYSEYFDTRNALANLLNLASSEGAWSFLVRSTSKPYVLAESAYFRHLTTRGYALHVYQSDHIDLCRVPGQRYARCVRYRANSIGSIRSAPLATAERLRFIVNSFMETSQYLRRLRALYAQLRASLPGPALPAWQQGAHRVGPLAVLPVVDALERDLRSASRGEAYFAHLLIPHYPYVLDEACRPRPQIAQWLSNETGSRAERYRRYAAQIRCQQTMLERIFAALKEAGVWNDAIVLIHGDHGSRILRTVPVAKNAGKLAWRDFSDGYSTLFAVRKPGLDAGIEAGLRPLQSLLGEASAIPAAPLGAKIYLRSENGAPLPRLELSRLR